MNRDDLDRNSKRVDMLIVTEYIFNNLKMKQKDILEVDLQLKYMMLSKLC